RIKVQAVGNIFFDVSDANFSIAPFIPAPFVTLDGAPLLTEDCSPGNGAIDPGEVVTVNVALRNIGSANTINLVATLAAAGGIIPVSAPQAYGALPSGGPAASRP